MMYQNKRMHHGNNKNKNFDTVFKMRKQKLPDYLRFSNQAMTAKYNQCFSMKVSTYRKN